MKWTAPAKINLSLEVLKKRADGYHEIESLMVPISLVDTLDIESSGEGVEFSCSDSRLPVDDTNLVVKAAKIFLSHQKINAGVKIHLEKAIPHGAGLGGGSSDAATTLNALNQMFDANLDLQTLSTMAAEIGSDIPFFMVRSAAICRGRGEIVIPVEFQQTLPLLLMKPSFGVATPWAYQRWSASKELSDIPYTAQSFAWGQLVNHLERPVFEKYLFLAVLKRWLLIQPEVAGALMSGSGSTTFAILHDPTGADALEQRVREYFGNLWIQPCLTISI